MICDIVTPDQMLFSGEVEFVSAPAADGEIGLLQAASPIISTLKSGEVRVKENLASEAQGFAVAGGYLESDGYKVVVLANRAIPSSMISIEIANQRIEKYQKRLAEAQKDDSRAIFYQDEIDWQHHLIKLASR